jgi:hypothetical protein
MVRRQGLEPRTCRLRGAIESVHRPPRSSVKAGLTCEDAVGLSTVRRPRPRASEELGRR